MFKNTMDETLQFSHDTISITADVKLNFVKLMIITYFTLHIYTVFCIISKNTDNFWHTLCFKILWMRRYSSVMIP